MPFVRKDILGRFVSVARSIAVALMVLSMIGCQTSAQEKYIVMQQNLRLAGQNTTYCMNAMETKPAYRSIARRTPVNWATDPTPAQLADESVPSTDDIKTFIALHNDYSSCREQAIEDFMEAEPKFIPILAEYLMFFDINAADLLQRKITWGQFNTRRLEFRSSFRAKTAEFTARFGRDLPSSGQAEMIRREAMDALDRLSYQQQILFQNKQVPDTLERPLITNCYIDDNKVKCSSR